MEHIRANTSAAGVAARMKQVEPRFSHRDVGFRTFQKFLAAAEVGGLVWVETVPGASDVVVHSGTPYALAPAAPVLSTPHLRVRPQIWRALQDHGETRPYYWVQSVATLNPPGEEQSSASVEGSSGALPTVDRGVPLFAVPDEQRLSWMRAFVDDLPPGHNSDALNAALSDVTPIASFLDAAKVRQNLSRKWSRFLRDKLIIHADDWARENDLPRSAVFVGEHRPLSPKPIAGTAPSLQRPPAFTQAAASSGVPDAALEAHLRERLVEAVQRMPLADLLRLSVPAEYLLRL